MEEKYKKFLQVDWTGNKDWQLYFSNLTPTPPGNKVLHFKKKFYKLKIDSDFDITYEPPQQQQQQQQNHQRNDFNFNNVTSIHGNSTFSKAVAFVEFILWSVSSILLITFNDYGTKVSLIPLLIRVFRRVGRPNLTYGFAQDVITDEHFHIFLFQALSLIDNFNIFTSIPYLLTVLLNVSDYMNRQNILKSYISKLVNKRVQIW